VVTIVADTNTLKNITGTIALAGAGKMGGAMLTGWLAGGLILRVRSWSSRIPRRDQGACRPGRAPQSAGCGCRTLVMAVKPQSFRDAGPMVRGFRRAVDAGVLDHGGHADCSACKTSAAAWWCARCPTRRLRSAAVSRCGAAKSVSAAQRATADALLRATGSVEWVEDES
jgi:pyrroline-5-carboxylate reductase